MAGGMMINAIEQFRDAIRASGLTPPDTIVGDGKLRRFAGNGNPRDDSAWYVFHDDAVPAGAFGCWRSDLTQKWRVDVGRTLTPVEQAAQRQREVEQQRAREADEAQRHEEAAIKARSVWKAAAPVGTDHPYLTKKGVAPVATLRELSADKVAAILGYAPKANGELLAGMMLIIPIMIDTAIASVEFIDEAGRKSALAGGTKRSGYWAAQKMPEGDGAALTLLIGEGVATVLSAREATGHPAIAALSCGNLGPVVRAMRQRYPAARLVILADLGNGEAKAEEAARDSGAFLARPDFGADRPADATDFNDLAQHRGLDAVERSIGAAKAPAVSEAQPNAASATAADSGPCVELLCAADVKPEAVRWHWDGWLAAGKLHILAGPAGTGKTTLALALAATITNGGRWPDGTRATPGDVVMWSGEDGIADTLVPRLIANGADVTRVRFVRDVSGEGGRRPFDPAADVPALELELARMPEPPALLIVDPIVSAVNGDSHKNAETRKALQPLVDLADSIGCAILGISHFSKGTAGRDPVERVTGSLAFGALARLVLAAVETTLPDGTKGPRLFARAKSNLGPNGGGFHYSLEQVPVPGAATGSRLLWGEPVEGDARTLLAAADLEADTDARSMTDEATDWLREHLSGGAMPADEAMRAARKMGHSDKAIRKARERLGVKPRKVGLRGGWEWALPGHATAQPHSEGAEDAQGAQPLKLGALDAFGDARAPSVPPVPDGEVF